MQYRTRCPFVRLVLPIVAAAAAAGCNSSSSSTVGRSADDDAPPLPATFSKSFGGPGYDDAMAAVPTSDGGYVFVGRLDGQTVHPDNSVGESDLSITKLDANGNLEWAHAIGEQGVRDGSRRRIFHAVRPLPGGGLVLVGRSGQRPGTNGDDQWIAKLAPDGTLEWTHDYDTGPWPGIPYAPARYGRGDFADDELHDVWLLPDGGFIAGGTSKANLSVDGSIHLDAEAAIVVRFDALGNVMWQRHLTDGQFYRNPLDDIVVQSPDVSVRGAANYDAVVAYEHAFDDDGERRLHVVRFNSGGDVLWTADLDKLALIDLEVTDDEPADGVRDDGVILAGGRGVVKLARDGSVEWRTALEALDTVHAVEQVCQAGSTPGASFDCDYVIAGHRLGSNGGPDTPFIARLTSDGDLVLRRNVPELDGVSDLIATDDGQFVVAAVSHRSLSRVVLDSAMLNVHARATSTEATGSPVLASPTELVATDVPQLITRHSSPSLLSNELVGTDRISLPALGAVAAGLATVEITPGSYVVGGFSDASGFGFGPWVLRITDGHVDWQVRFDERHNRTISAMAVAPDGGIVLVMSLVSPLPPWVDSTVVKLTADGEAVWESASLGRMRLAEIHALPDGGVIAGGSFLDMHNTKLIRISAAGELTWERWVSSTSVHSFALLDDDNDGVDDDGFLVAGPGRARNELFIVEKIDALGKTRWTRGYGLPGAILAEPGVVKIRPTPDGGYVVATTETGAVTDATNHPFGESNILLMKFDHDGNRLWSRSYGAFLDERLNDLHVTADGGLLIAGSSDSLGDGSEAWILRLGPDGLLAEGCNAYLGTLGVAAFDVRAVSSGGHVLKELENGFALSPPNVVPTTTRGHTPQISEARQCIGVAAPPGPPLLPAAQFELTLTQPGTATGVVTSSPAGIVCGTASRPPPCTSRFTAGEPVFLDVDPGSTSSFVRFEGCDELVGDASGAASCRVNMDGDREVRAIFGSARDRFRLQIGVLGTGTVRSGDPDGISCGAFFGSAQDCDAIYDAFLAGTTEPTTITLGVFTHADRFLGWGGDCAAHGNSLSFNLVMDADKSCTAIFDEARTGFELMLETTGVGTIVSAPAGINCPATCTAGFPANETIRLSATEGNGSVFDGWTGCDRLTPPPAGSIPLCEVDLTTDRTIGAAFRPLVGSEYLLEVAVTGADGIVESGDHGIICTSAGPDCQESYNAGQSVALTATLLRGGGTFLGWGGDCASFGVLASINVLMNAAKTCTASFTDPPAPAQHMLTITKRGGNSLVLSTPAGIDCGAACTAQFPRNQTVRLAAAPVGPFTFSGWTGCDRFVTGGNAWPDCELDMTADRVVEIRFE